MGRAIRRAPESGRAQARHGAPAMPVSPCFGRRRSFDSDIFIVWGFVTNVEGEVGRYSVCITLCWLEDQGSTPSPLAWHVSQRFGVQMFGVELR